MIGPNRTTNIGLRKIQSTAVLHKFYCLLEKTNAHFTFFSWKITSLLCILFFFNTKLTQPQTLGHYVLKLSIHYKK